MDRPLRNKNRITLSQIAAILVTGFMVLADWYTLRDLFIELVNATDAHIYAMILATTLEGLPFYLGMLSAEGADVGHYYKNDFKTARTGFWIALFALFCAFTITASLRILMIYNMRLMGEFNGRRGFEKLIPQLFLTVSPLLTSLLSYVASWFTFRSSYLEKAYNETLEKQEFYLQRREEFREAYDLFQGTRSSLWFSLEDAETLIMPRDSESFRTECFTRIRKKLVANCLACYPTQIERYTQEVNSALERCIQELAMHTTIPHAITDISVSELISQHDKNARDYADCWDYNMAGPELEGELHSMLDQAVVVAQSETTVRQN